MATGGTPSSNPSRLPPQAQESIVIEDLLYMLMGIEGKYINFREGPFPMAELDGEVRLSFADLMSTRFYTIHNGLDPSLIDFIKRILPLATCYTVIEAFCTTYAKFTAGFVNHAVCGAMRTITKEYSLLLVQLENEFRTNPDFSLQKMWYYLVPSASSLQSTAEICLAIHDQSRLYTSNAATRFPSMTDLPRAGSSTTPSSAATVAMDVDPPTLSGGASAANLIKLHHKGGGILAMLSHRYISQSGDPTARKLHQYLLAHASVPFLTRLRKWIHLGKLDDPYDEFMIVEHSVPKQALAEDFNEKYWEQRYEIRKGAVPPFLEPYATMVLHTGKYLNVYIECGAAVHLAAEDMAARAAAATRQATALGNAAAAASARGNVSMSNAAAAGGMVLTDLATAVDGSGAYIAEIEAAYRLANKHLLDLLVNKHALLPRLASLKHYMLLDHGDFFDHFLDAALPELTRPYEMVRLDKVQSLLDIAMRNPSSVICRDAYKEDVVVSMEKLPLLEQLLAILGVSTTIPNGGGASMMVDGADSIGGLAGGASTTVGSGTAGAGANKVYHGIHALVLDHKIDFPLSLVFGRRSIIKYQLLFRNLVQLKYLERLLGSTWLYQSRITIQRRGNEAQTPLAAPAATVVMAKLGSRLAQLRMRMLAVVQAMLSYITVDVIEPLHADMEKAIVNAQTVDDVLNSLTDFFANCFRDAFMSNSKLLRIYSKMVDLITRYTHICDSYIRLAQLKSLDAQQPATTDRLIGLERALDKVDQSWSYHVRLLIESLKLFSSTESPRFLVFMNRLDYNGYYADENGREGVLADF
ncbi:gamma-tubulin complex component protein [Catenaria anguillulae PL171]|uniref:Spindle pole body component n=1 Tax=Catenaria anguillulae PL171 TaxID=765915 RepID=A0A1Y2H740_9FUNG|nr:gamma-tubulin complex component protein [Catenaria anguillulae PL171]